MAQGKIFASAADAVADIFSGATVCFGGFGPRQNRPTDLSDALAGRPEVKDLTVVSNGFPHDPLAANKQVKKFIGAFGGSVYRRESASEEMIRTGELIFEPTPQGIMTERLRATAAGIPAFYSPVGVDTVVAEGKERRTFKGREFIMEEAIPVDFAFVRAQVADEMGNLSGVGSTINFHPTMAAAGKITIAEVDKIVPLGELSPDDVKIPGIYIDRLVLHDPTGDAEAEAARLRTNARERAPAEGEVGISPQMMALRVSQMLEAGQYVNLGMGLPTLVGGFIRPESGVLLHAENGIIGYGPAPSEDEYQWYYFNASAQPVTVQPGASFFSSLEAFTMARGGHLDVVILGGLQVSVKGDLANWWAPYMAAGGMGGAMDLCAGAKKLIVIMDHVTRDGGPKILNECNYPLTGSRCVSTIVTNLCVIDVTPEGLVLKELAPGVSVDYVRERTEAPLTVAPDCHEMTF